MSSFKLVEINWWTKINIIQRRNNKKEMLLIVAHHHQNVNSSVEIIRNFCVKHFILLHRFNMSKENVFFSSVLRTYHIYACIFCVLFSAGGK